MYLALFETPQATRDYWASHYRLTTLFPREALRQIFSLSPAHLLAARQLPAEGRVLDAGCGFGPISILNPHTSNEIVGIDSSSELIRLAARFTPASHFHVGSITALPYQNEAFDMYLAISSLELVPEGLDRPLSEAFRVLKRGGRLLVVCPRLQPDSLLAGRKRVQSTMGALRLVRVASCRSPLPQGTYGYYYSLGEICRSAGCAGFSSVKGARTDVLGGLLYGRLFGGYLRRLMSISIDAPAARARTSSIDQAVRRLCNGLLRYETAHPLSHNPLHAVAQAFYSFWNVVTAIRQ